MSADLKDLARRAYDIIGSGDLDDLDDLAHPDFVDHNPDPVQEPGLAGVKEAFRGMRGAFSDLKAVPEAMYVDGDTVISRVRITGTHKGEFMGIPATGSSIDVEVIDIVRIVDGKAKERWGVFDAMTMMQQLGQVPA
jgi:predicted ester cyclase